MKVTLAFSLLTLGLVVAFFGHAIATGILLPYPDPTPAQAAHERLHHPISSALFLAAGASLAATLASAIVAACLWTVRVRRRARPVDPAEPPAAGRR